MNKNLESVSLINRKFDFVGYSKDKLVFKNIDEEVNEMRILEIELNDEEQKIKKIDIYTIEDQEGVESIHIKRGIDGITEIDYYPVYDKLITMDKKTNLYNMTAYIVYSENNDEFYYEVCKLQLIKKGHKRHKILTQLPITKDLFITLDNKFHHVSSQSLDDIRNLSKNIIPDIKEIEKNIFTQSLSTKEEIEPQLSLEEVIEKYPNSIYIYDRSYDLIGMRNNALIYQNLEDDITEVEISLDENKVNEVKFIYYKDNEVEGIKNRSKKEIIRLVKEEDCIKASLCNRSKETIRLNDESIEKTMIKVDAIISFENKIEELNLTFDNELGNYELSRTYNLGNYFVDKEGNEYTLTSYSYLTFKTLISFAPGIFRGLERKLVESKKEENQNKMLIKN